MQLCSAKCTSTARLDGKTIVVTGCNTGLGKETARDFYKRGGKVIMACRTVSKAQEAKEDLEKTTEGPNLGKLIVMKLDLGSLKSVREFAEEVLRQEEQINILVNNAGVMTTPEGKTEDGFETQFGTNHLGHFLLTLLLLPRIIRSAPARIVTVSSVGHRYGTHDFNDPNYENREYKSFEAYGQSKLANVIFSKELDKRLKDHGITDVHTYSLHPGGVQSELSRNMDTAYCRGMGWFVRNVMSSFLKTPWQGAQTSIYCAVDEKCANESGMYYEECKLKTPDRQVQNSELAAKLWKISLKFVDLEQYDPFTSS